jgi:hypothetical protein
MSTPVNARKKKTVAPFSAKRKAAKRSEPMRSKSAAADVPSSGAKTVVTVARLKGGLTPKLMSRLTGFSVRAIAGWEAGDPVSEAARRRLLKTERFRDKLAQQVVAADAIPEWLDSPSDAFGSLKPIEVIDRGEIDRLWNMIFYLDSDVAS